MLKKYLVELTNKYNAKASFPWPKSGMFLTGQSNTCPESNSIWVSLSEDETEGKKPHKQTEFKMTEVFWPGRASGTYPMSGYVYCLRLQAVTEYKKSEYGCKYPEISLHLSAL